MKGTKKAGASRTELTLFVGKIPLTMKLTRLASETESGLKLFSPLGNPIRYKKVDSLTGEEVQTSDIRKGKEVGDTVVTFSEDELSSAYATKEKEVRKVRVQDFSDIPDSFVKSVFAVKPANATFWGMIGGRIASRNKELAFNWVEGKQERNAVLRFDKGVPILRVLYFESEVVETTPSTPECKPEHASQVDTLLDMLGQTELPKAEEKRNSVIDSLIEARLLGKEIPKKEVVAIAKTEKTAEELLKESLMA